MLNAKLLVVAMAGFATVASYAPAYADSGYQLSFRSMNGESPADRDLKYHGVDCVEPYCIHNPDGSLNHQKSYEAFQKAHQ